MSTPEDRVVALLDPGMSGIAVTIVYPVVQHADRRSVPGVYDPLIDDWSLVAQGGVPCVFEVPIEPLPLPDPCDDGFVRAVTLPARFMRRMRIAVSLSPDAVLMASVDAATHLLGARLHDLQGGKFALFGSGRRAVRWMNALVRFLEPIDPMLAWVIHDDRPRTWETIIAEYDALIAAGHEPWDSDKEEIP